MINLIQNELIKIFKKKSIYIILAICLTILVIGNVVAKNQKQENYPVDERIAYYEKMLKEYTPEKASDTSSYIEIKAEIETLKLMKQYGTDSWQASIISQKASEYLKQMNTYQYGSEKNKESYQKVESKYQDLLKRLDSNDWKYFVTTELEEVNAQLKEAEQTKQNTVDKIDLKKIESTIYDLELQKQALSWRLEKDINYGNSYQNKALERYYSSQMAVYSYESTENHEYDETQSYYTKLERANISKYDIEHNTQTGDKENARGALLDFLKQYEVLIIIIIVMIAGSIVSEEFNKGTIKLLLVKPYSRVKILLSKFITCIIMIILATVFLLGVQFVLGGILFGFDTYGLPAVVYNFTSHQIESMNILKYITMLGITKLPFYILVGTIAFGFSTIFTNTALATVISLLGYMSKEIINLAAQEFHIELLKFFITPNWDLSQFLFGHLPTVQYVNPGFSATMCIVYLAVMLIPTFVIFKKKNIKNI